MLNQNSNINHCKISIKKPKVNRVRERKSKSMGGMRIGSKLKSYLEDSSNIIDGDDFKNRALGSMIGLAVGDALGAPVEFLKRGTFPPLTSYQSGGKFNLSKGDYTDDTAMALCLADSLIHCKGINQIHQLETYVKWLNEGYMSSTGKAVGCGKNTYLSLLKFMKTGEKECGNSKMKKMAGNGSLMRIAPIAIFYKDNLFSAMEAVCLSSYTTHGLKICADASILYTGLLLEALTGESKKDLLDRSFIESSINLFDYEFDETLLTIMYGGYKNKSIDEIKSTGYVLYSLEAALWCFYNSNNFKDGALMAVNLGYDSDTVGAIYGMLAGAYYGLDGIDEELKTDLTNYELIKSITEKLIETSKQVRKNFK